MAESEIVPSWEVEMAVRIESMINERDGPLMIALVGIPGAGKTTSASILSKLLPAGSALALPMDGYHYPVSHLRSMANPDDMVYRRGAPDTFDAIGLKRDLERIRFGTEEEILLPGFDHAVGDPQDAGHCFIRSRHNILIMEGLYLLHDQGDWEGARDCFDFKIFITSDIDKCIERLKIRNKCIPGYTAQEIDIRCDAVDRKNAELVSQDACKADAVVSGVAQ